MISAWKYRAEAAGYAFKDILVKQRALAGTRWSLTELGRAIMTR